MNSMKLTLSADKAVFPTMDDVAVLESLVREELIYLKSLTLTDWTHFLRKERSRHGSRESTPAVPHRLDTLENEPQMRPSEHLAEQITEL
jgi:hypothetical protein